MPVSRPPRVSSRIEVLKRKRSLNVPIGLNASQARSDIGQNRESRDFSKLLERVFG